jgi:ubiquinol-cytochrome c reductase cytochrome b subunit
MSEPSTLAPARAPEEPSAAGSSEPQPLEPQPLEPQPLEPQPSRLEPSGGPRSEASKGPSTLGSGGVTSAPPRGVLGFLAERAPLGAMLADLARAPVPDEATWLRAIHGAFVASLVVLFVTGLALMTAYAPTTQGAWASVHWIQTVAPGGKLVRALHHFASHAAVVLALLAIFGRALARAYRSPYEVAWWLGLLVVPLTLGLSITGHALPWDQFGYWARRVELNIAAMAPGGDALLRAGLGGSELGNVALVRFYTLHVAILPALLVGVMVLQRALVTRVAALEQRRGVPSEPWFPRQASRDLAAGVVAFAVIVALALRGDGAPLDGPADPQSEYPARPEWFLLAMYQLRHYMKGAMEVWGTSSLPAFLGLWLVLMPLVDRRREARPASRALALGPFALGLLVWAGLSQMARKADANDPKYREAVAKAETERALALRLAAKGVPPEGPLAMIANDPDVRGARLYAKSCAACHVLGELGDKKKFTAPTLDGFSTEAWITRVMHEPDADDLFGRTPFKDNMPSQDVPPKGDAEGFVAMTPEQMKAVAHFLFVEGVEKGEPVTIDEELRKKGEGVVKLRCTICHTYKGKGDDGGNGVAPELSRYGSFAWVKAQIQNPATPATYREKALDPELKGHMPRFDTELSPADIDVLTAYVRRKSRGLPSPP